MKSTKTLAVLLFLFTGALNAQETSSAGAYMNYYGNFFDKIAKDNWSYASAVARGKGARKIESKRQEVIQSTHEAALEIKRSKDYNGDASLRDSLLSYLDLSYIVLKEDFAKIMDMEEIAEQSYDAMEALIMAREMANDKLDRASERMSTAYDKFAESHGVQISENRKDVYKKLEKAGEVFDYYNDVYLIFFKSYKQESYMMEAWQKGDVNAMQQNATALTTTSTEGLEKLKDYKSFLSDSQLRLSCEQMLKFYLEEASEKMPVVINFYNRKANFEKIQQVLESKKKNQRTQEDVDKYNSALAKYNEVLNDYNKINEELNANRGKMLDNWNDRSAAFLDKHIPQ